MKTLFSASALFFAFVLHTQGLVASEIDAKRLDRVGVSTDDFDEPSEDTPDSVPRRTLTSDETASSPSTQNSRFKRAAVLKARFGEDHIGRVRQKASHLAEELNKVIFGQELVNEELESSLTQYLEDFGHRKREPIHLNLMGFPGSGKTALVQKIEKITGVKVIILNAQSYVDDAHETFPKDVRDKVEKEVSEGRPVILAVDEIDKVPEITTEFGKEVEMTSQFIGGLNSMISEGKIFQGNKPVSVSNVMLITMMNYPPTQIESFSTEVLETEKKSFYEFTLEDFARFDTWLRSSPSSAHRILAKLFRANTVSRLAPNTLILQSFTNEVYLKLIDNLIQERIQAYESGPKAERRLSVDVDPSVAAFFLKHGVVPSSGARETVNFVDKQLGRLLDYAQKSAGPKEHHLDRPRRVKITVLPEESRAALNITPLTLRNGKFEDLESFTVYSDFNPANRAFRRPAEFVAQAPILIQRHKAIEMDEDAEPKLTKKEVRATRFPPDAVVAKGLAKDLKTEFFDQDQVLTQLESDLLKFMSRKVENMNEPMTRVLAGFPGNPGVKIVQEISKRTDLPLLRINLSQFTSDEEATVGNFQHMLESMIDESVGYDEEQVKHGGRFMILLEGLEELIQKDAMGGDIPRPVMGFIKDLIGMGRAEYTNFDEEGGMVVNSTAANRALIYITYNFPVERFGFEGDPRMTSVEDVQRAFARLTKHPADLKELLKASFKPDTVSAILPRLTLLSPYKEDSYRKIITQKLAEVAAARLHDKEGVNRARIVVDATNRYMQYMFDESVIASEGATNTETTVKSLASSQLEAALDRLPRTRDYSGEPLFLRLDFDPMTSTVSASIRLLDDKKQKLFQIYEQKVSRMFPSVKASGPMKPNRLETAAHEFGHAFAAVTLGTRIDRVLAVPLKREHGGFVSFKEVGDSAIEAISHLYVALASRALERMVSNENPRDQLSVIHIGQGSSADIEMATENLYSLIYELGLLPHSGVIDRRAKFGPADAANIFPSLTPEEAQKLGYVLQDLEDYMVDSFLKAHGLDWYVDKITRLAVEGAMSEKEFYELIEYPFPGENRQFIYRNINLEKLFAGSIIESAKEIQLTRETKVGDETVEERMLRYVEFFRASVEKRFGMKDACESMLKQVP